MDIAERLNDHAEFCDKVKRFADADCYRKGAEEIARLRAELESARVDAERYRWLRKGDHDDIAVVRGLGAMDYGMSGVVYTYSEEIDGDDLDAAIDAARGGK